MQKATELFEKMNEWGSKRIPFLFLVDFLKTKGKIIPLDQIQNEIQFKINSETENIQSEIQLKKHPISFEEYRKQFQNVQTNILLGNSYLTNLTCATPIEINLSLDEIFKYSKARYKLLLKDQFVCFSPETFVKIQNGWISSYPMKGTIDASVQNAKEKILNDPKEKAEHFTIVDLIRNDLSKVAQKVSVPKFRYVDEIKTHQKTLLQVSSEVRGELPKNFNEKLGDIFYELLPAGSICGAPKTKTVEIILDAESYDRNFYTGVFGVFDGENLDSAVMIRFIEKTENGLLFKSGGGITHLSRAEEEYQEMIDKIYVPIN